MKRNLLFLAFFFLLALSARATVYYVDSSRVDNTGNGQSWAAAKKDIQAAINAAAAGDEIWVKAGTYLPTLDPNGSASPTDPRDKTFYITTKDIKLYGGFAGTETLLSQRNATTNATILSGDLDGAGNNDAYHVLLTIGCTYDCVVDGFTITGGRANGSGFLSVGSPATNVDKNNGGGMCNYSSSPKVQFCIFSANTANNAGGGIYNNNGSPAVSGCVFSANTTGNNGGGMYNDDGSMPPVFSCSFSANTAGGNGGGIYYTSDAGGTVSNCILYGNAGGPVNRQNIYKDGINETLNVRNSLIGDYSATATNNYNSITGIIAADPLFVNASSPAGADGVFRTADDGLRLQSCSPAINAGNGTTPTTDISGNGRVGAMDLGAYEYQGSPAAPTLASGATTTDSSTLQQGSVVSFGGCGAAIAEVLSEGTQPAEGIISATMYVHNTAPSFKQTAYVRRHYDISTILFPSTATARITLYFTQADFDDYNTAIQGSSLPPLPVDATDAANNKTNLRISQEHGTSSTGLPGSYSGWGGASPANVLITPNVSWSSFLGLWKVQFRVTGFSGFFLTSAISTPLPLKLLAFNARRTGETAHQLDWMTGQEAAGTTFVVERSGDGQHFTSIGIVGGQEGGSSYRFEDKEPLPGANYYRLQLKEPGHAGYSQTLLLKGAGRSTGDVRIMPNPATAHVTIACTNAALEGSAASVWSTQGRLMTTFVLARENSLDVREWPVGTYVLRLADGTMLRLVKQ